MAVQVTPSAASEVVSLPKEPAYWWSMVHGAWWSNKVCNDFHKVLSLYVCNYCFTIEENHVSRVPPSIVQRLSLQCSHLEVQAQESSEWHRQLLKVIEPSLLTERFCHCFIQSFVGWLLTLLKLVQLPSQTSCCSQAHSKANHSCVCNS